MTTSETPNQALQRTAAGRLGCNRRVSWPPLLSLGRDFASPLGLGRNRTALSLPRVGVQLISRLVRPLEERLNCHVPLKNTTAAIAAAKK